MRAKLISLSGIDGAGKSSQIVSIKNYYKKRNQPFFYLWTRGGNTQGVEKLKTFIRRIAGRKLPPSGHSVQRDKMFEKNWIQTLWLTFAIIDLMIIYSVNIRWKLFLGFTVICDRYLWDTLIDFKIMFPNIDVDKWIIWRILVWCSPVPSVEYLLMIPIDISEKRCLQKYEPFPDTPEQRSCRYSLYKKMSSTNEWILIDATQSAEDVFDEIQQQLP